MDFERIDRLAADAIKPHPLARFRSPPGDVPQEPGFILNGIICDKVSFIGAYAGAGKTTAFAPLALMAAGLITVPGIDIYGWRRVVYISEHPEQLEMIFVALIKYHSIDSAKVWERIKIVEAARMSATEVAKVSPNYRALTVTHTENGNPVEFAPWVIVDTQSALFSVDNENDNAEMGAIVSVLKRDMALPVSVIAHTAKVNKHGDAETMSIRGGGALEGDANQILYVSIDKDTKQRYLEVSAPKHRFVAQWDALKLTYHTIDLPVLDPYLRTVRRPVGFCTIEPVAKIERLERKAAAAEARKRETIKDAREAVLARVVECRRLARDNPDDPDYYPSKNKLEQALSGSGEHPRSAVRAAIGELLDEKRIAAAKRPKDGSTSGPRDYFVPVKIGGEVSEVVMSGADIR